LLQQSHSASALRKMLQATGGRFAQSAFFVIAFAAERSWASDPTLVGCFSDARLNTAASPDLQQTFEYSSDIYTDAHQKATTAGHNVFAIAMGNTAFGYIATASSFTAVYEEHDCADFFSCPGQTGKWCGCVWDSMIRAEMCAPSTGSTTVKRWAVYKIDVSSSSAVPAVRYTTNGCACKTRLSCGGQACCNSDDDPKGEWCIVAESSCEGNFYGYCELPSTSAESLLVTAPSGGSCQAGLVAGTVQERTFVQQGQTASGAPYFTSQSYLMYYAPDCSGDGRIGPMWIIKAGAASRIDPTRTSDLAEDGSDCVGLAYVQSASTDGPPPSAGWTVSCSGTWTDIVLIMAPVTGGTTELRLSGIDCPGSTTNENYNGRWLLKSISAAGYPIFQHADEALFLFYDPSCDGSSTRTGRWVLTYIMPDPGRQSDLDGDGKCSYGGDCMTDETTPPSTCLWDIACSDTWMPMTVTIEESAAMPTTTAADSSPWTTTTTTQFATSAVTATTTAADSSPGTTVTTNTTKKFATSQSSEDSCRALGNTMYIQGESAGFCRCLPGFEGKPEVTKTGYTGSCVLPDGTCFWEVGRCVNNLVDSEMCLEDSYEESVSDLSGTSMCEGGEISAGVSLAIFSSNVALSREICTESSKEASTSNTKTFNVYGLQGQTTVGCVIGIQTTLRHESSGTDVTVVSYRKAHYTVMLDNCPDYTCAYSPVNAQSEWRRQVADCSILGSCESDSATPLGGSAVAWVFLGVVSALLG